MRKPAWILSLALVAGMVGLMGGPAIALHTVPGTVFVNTATCPALGDGSHGIPFCSIQAAVGHASAGDTVEVAAGAYAENVTIDKPLALMGAGPASTTISPASGNAVLVDMAAAGETVRIEGFEITAPGGSGIGLSSTTVLGTLEAVDLMVHGNHFNGLAKGDDAELAALHVSDSSFSENGFQGGGGSGDINLRLFSGDATFTNVDIMGDASPSLGHYAIQLKGVLGAEEGPPPGAATCNAPDVEIGNVNFTNVSISGAYSRPPLYIQCYQDLAGLSFTDVTTNIPDAGGAWAEMFVGHIQNGPATPTLDLGNTDFMGAKPTNISVGNFTGGLRVDATGALFDGNPVSDDPFAAEDAVTHRMDVRFGDSPTRGLVRFVADNLYVTENSASSPAGTTGGIQRAVDVASAGETINVAAGAAYPEEAVTVAKDLTLLGAQAGVDARGRTGYETELEGSISATDAADDITVDGFQITTTDAAPTGVALLIESAASTIQNNRIVGVSPAPGFTQPAQVAFLDVEDLIMMQNDVAGVDDGREANAVLVNGLVNSTATIQDNHIHGAGGGGLGLMVSNPNAVVTVSGNDLIDNGTDGMWVWHPAGATFDSIAANLNNFTGNGGLGINHPVGAEIDGTCNWWGDLHGPSGEGAGGGDGVSTNVDFAPWLTSAAPGGDCIGNPTPPSKNACRKQGWQSYDDDNVRPFTSQGDCLSYVATGGKNKAKG